MCSSVLCLLLTNENMSFSFLGFTMPILVAIKHKCFLFLSDVLLFLTLILCVYISLTSECGHKELKPKAVQPCFLFWFLQKFSSDKRKKNRETYQIPLNFKSHFSFSWHFYQPPALPRRSLFEKFTLCDLPLDGALILLLWSCLGL